MRMGRNSLDPLGWACLVSVVLSASTFFAANAHLFPQQQSQWGYSPWSEGGALRSSFHPIGLSGSLSGNPVFIHHQQILQQGSPLVNAGQAAQRNTAATDERKMLPHGFDYDLLIVGCGVGGHGAALHAVSRGLKTAVLTAGDIGGTCVNRGCIPSKALLAASGQLHAMSDHSRLAKLGLKIEGQVQFHRETMASHASSLASNLRHELEKSLKRHGVSIIEGRGVVVAPHTVQSGSNTLTAKDIILAPGSAPAVPPGITVDEDRIFTSNRAVHLHRVPQWVAIIGSGYIGFEFADIYSALGSEVTLIDAEDRVLPTFDPDLAKMAERLILKPRGIEVRTGVIAEEILPGNRERPVVVRLRNTKSGKSAGVLEVDAVMIATGRQSQADGLGLETVNVELTKQKFVPVDDHMRVLARTGAPVPNLFCIGDANGKLMLAHTASAQGVAAVETIIGGRHQVVNHHNIPASCFTHPEISSVGLSEKEALAMGAADGFLVGKATSHFRANSKALAELENGGMVKLLYRKDTGHILGAHMIGLHSSDLVQQVANAMAARQTVEDLAFTVHSHPTLGEVLLDAYKQCAGLLPH